MSPAVDTAASKKYWNPFLYSDSPTVPLCYVGSSFGEKSEYDTQAAKMIQYGEKAKFFLAIKSRAELSAQLDLPYKRLCYIIYAQSPDDQYDTFNIAKNYKKQRTIDAPHSALKNIQKKLADILEVIYHPTFFAHAFIKGKSIVTNAKPHLKAHTIIKTDIADFFGSINFGRVMGLFRAAPFHFPQEVAIAIARIACKNGKLPQGSPLSPIIANMICLKLDAQLGRFAKTNRLQYTRYADDMTFSSKEKTVTDFSYDATKLFFKSKLESILRLNGFELNSSKFRIKHGHDSKVITGIKVNAKLNTIRKRMREVRAMIHAYAKFGNDGALEKYEHSFSRRKSQIKCPDFSEIIKGKIAFLSMVKGKNDPVVINLKTQLENTNILLKKSLLPSSKLLDKYCAHKSETHCIIYTEGKTDRIHLIFALRRLRAKGLFRNLNVVFYCWPAHEEGETTLEKLFSLAKVSKFCSIPKILIFDRDIRNPDQYDMTLAGNNIWSILLPIPPNRLDFAESISIEHFYTDATLYHCVEQGFRIYTLDEFDNTASPFEHTLIPGLRLSCKAHKREYSILEKVLNSDGKNVCLSKREFARAIAQGAIPLSEADTTNFIPIFETISQIIRRNAM